MAGKLTVPILLVPATAPTFAEYQLIHQTQERQRYPATKQARQPVTSDSWRQKLKLWLSLVGTTGLLYWLWAPKRLVGWALVMAVLTMLGLLYQRWEYWRAFREQQTRLKPESFELTEEGLLLHFPTGSSVFHRWESLYRIQDIGPWLLFYPGVDYCYYLDLRQLPAPLTVADVRALINWQELRLPPATFAE